MKLRPNGGRLERMDQSPGGEIRVFNVAACPVFCLQTHRPAM